VKFTSIPQCNAAIARDSNLKSQLGQKTGNYMNPCPTIISNGGNY